jgi:DNA polymerase-3 subunit gamma/tau
MGAKGFFIKKRMSMAYESTATKKRPQSFEELAGQEFVVTTLTSSVRQGRIAHAYLFSGPRGVGKTSAARILAKALNCEQGPTATPCGVCSSCREITQGNSLDVLEIDGASNTSVNDIRDLKDEVLFAPNAGRYKIYIIDEVHMLSTSAFNALLKTIEEPPPYIVFIFATTEVHKVPATIRSRCQQFNFRLIATEQIKRLLATAAEELGVTADEQALFWIAKEATGSLRDAYTLLDQVISFSAGGISLESIQEKLGLVASDQINRIGETLTAGDKKQVMEMTAAVLDKGISVEQFVIDLAEYFRNLLLLKSGVKQEGLLSASPASFSAAVVEFFTALQLEKALEMTIELYRHLKYSLNSRFELELLMSRLTDLPDLISPAEVLEAVRRVKNSPAGSEGAAAGLTAFRTAAPPAAAAGEGGQPVPTEKDTLQHLIDMIKKEKLALATSLQKADSWSLDGDLLTLVFKAGDKYSGEHVKNEKEILVAQAGLLLSQPMRIDIQFKEQPGRSTEGVGNQVEMVRKVFRGEIVQGE